MHAQLTCMKRALKHDPQTAIGQRGPMHLDCICDAVIPVPNPFSDELVTCEACGRTYDSGGWVKGGPKVTLQDCSHGLIQATCTQCHPQGNILTGAK